MHLQKTLKDDGGHNIELKVWPIISVQFHSEKVGQERVVITLGGYRTEQDYLSGFNPVGTKNFKVPLAEPEEGDEFTDLRSIIQTVAEDIKSKSMALVRKTRDWGDAVEK